MTSAGASRRCAGSTSTPTAPSPTRATERRAPTLLGGLQSSGELHQVGDSIVELSLARERRARLARGSGRSRRRRRAAAPRNARRRDRPLHGRERGALRRRRARPRACGRDARAAAAPLVRDPGGGRAHHVPRARRRGGALEGHDRRGARGRSGRLPERRRRDRRRRRRAGRLHPHAGPAHGHRALHDGAGRDRPRRGAALDGDRPRAAASARRAWSRGSPALARACA